MATLGGPLKLPKVGQTIDGKYTLERVLGRGGMAIVYEATHIRLRQQVAIKMLLPSVCDLPETVKRFEREARAAVQLRGPNVTRVLDVDTMPVGIPYIVMELLDGHDLAEEMQKRGQIPIAEAVGFVLQACSAMFEAHALGIIHRDLKPSNLFVCKSGEAHILKVLDFGIVKLESGESTVTRAETVLGTPAYMSPEQIRSAMTVDARTDIWSLGVILYELLANELPFQGTNAPSMSNSILNEAPKPLKPRRPDAPDALIAAVMTALSKDLNERYPDVRAFAEAIASYGPAPGTWTPPALASRGSTPAPRGSRPESADDNVSLDAVPLDSTSASAARAAALLAAKADPKSNRAPRSGAGSPQEETVAEERRAPVPVDLSRTAASPRLTPALGLGGLAILVGVGFMAFMMGRGGGAAGWEPAAAVTPPAASAAPVSSAPTPPVGDAGTTPADALPPGR